MFYHTFCYFIAHLKFTLIYISFNRTYTQLFNKKNIASCRTAKMQTSKVYKPYAIHNSNPRLQIESHEKDILSFGPGFEKSEIKLTISPSVDTS